MLIVPAVFFPFGMYCAWLEWVFDLTPLRESERTHPVRDPLAEKGQGSASAEALNRAAAHAM